jgi:hypothetical protein
VKYALAAERRRCAALLPPEAACEDCGTPDALTLDANLAPIRCADHAALAARQNVAERHHIGRRSWNIVLDLTPNWHRIVTALQRMRKGVTYRKMAELLYGIGDLIYAIADYVARQEEGDQKPCPTK